MVPFKVWLWSLCYALYDFWDEKKMDIKFDPVRVFQHRFPFFISLIHIWHYFSFGLLFQTQMVTYMKIVAGFLLLSPMNEISPDDFIKHNCWISQGYLVTLCVVNLAILEIIVVGFVISVTYARYCNTPGVCHQLSSGFELKHDRLSGEDDVKVNLWRWA
jgi:hypothetical protein